MSFKAGSIVGEAFVDTKRWDSGLKKLGKTAKVASLAIAAAFVAGMTVAVKKANEFQIAMSNVASITDETAVSTQDLTKQLLALDPALGNTTELTNGLYQAFSAGASTSEEAMQITIDSAKFAKAAITDVATSVDVLTTAINAYGKENVTSTLASDLFFKTVEQGKITGEELASTIGQSIPLFASTGIHLKELTSGIAAMTKQGVKASEATTQLNAIVNAFLKPGEGMQILLGQIGAESGAAFLKAEGLSGALKLIEQETKGDAAAMAELLPNIRALRGAMALTGVGGQEFTSVLEKMENATGATDKAFQEQEKTFATFKNSIDKILIVAGNIAKFFIDGIVKSATSATESLVAFMQSAQFMEIVGNIVGFVAGAFETLKMVITPIVQTVLPILGEIFEAIGNALGTLVGKTDGGSTAFKALAFAINLTTSVLKVIGVAITSTINNFSNLIQAILEGGKTVSTFFQFLAGKKTWDEVKDQASSTAEAFKTFGVGVVDGIVDVWGTAIEEVKSFGEETNALAEQMETNVTTRFANAKDMVVTNWGEMTTGMQDFAGEVQQTMGEEVPEVVEEYATTVEEVLDEVEEETEEHVETMLEKINHLWSTASEVATFGLNAMQEVSNLETQNRLDQLQIENDAVMTQLNEKRELELADRAQAKIDLDTFQLDRKLGLEAGYASDLIDKATFEKQSADIAIMAAQEELALRQKNLDADEFFKEEQLRIEQQNVDKVNDIKKKQFESQKLLDTAKVWVSAGSAIMGWWESAATLGPVAGPIFAGVMTALTLGTAAEQSSLIASQQFVPAKEKGGMAGGMTRVNEAGGEIISLPDGSQVIPNDISRQIAGDSGGNTINVSFDGAVISNMLDLEVITNHVSMQLAKQMRGFA